MDLLIALPLAMGHLVEIWMLGVISLMHLTVYYQRNNQLDGACKFPNVSIITKNYPSVGSCKFPVMIEPYYGGTERTVGSLQKPVILASGLILFLLKIL